MDGAKGIRREIVVVVMLLPRQEQRELHISSVHNESRSRGSGESVDVMKEDEG